MKSKTEEIYKGIPASKGISMGKPFVYRAEMPSYNHYSGIDIVIVFKEEGKIKQIPISRMMPYPWPKPNFQEKLDKIKRKKVK